MGVWGAVIGGVAGAAYGGISSYAAAKEHAKSYKEAARQIREAAKKYSGSAADNAMNEAGRQMGNELAQKSTQAAASRGNLNSTSDMANALAGAQNVSANNAYMTGNQLGRSNKATELSGKYNAATTEAQNLMNQADVQNKVTNATNQTVMNTAGGLVDLYKQLKPASSQTTSDERVKEYDNHSDLPKADVDDALRRIESIEYQYKPETGLDSEEHVGVTAQSVEGTAFDGMVSENKNGVKQLDKQMMLEAVLAGIASMRKELDELEDSDKITSDEGCKFQGLLKTTYRK